MSLLRLLPKVFTAMALALPAAHADQPRAVIEMFTSQGCNSCPPADRLVGELIKDPNVIALTYNVTYWDYLGWRDTLALPENTERQRSYAAGRGDRQVYTPQAVVDGMYHAVGSDARDIEAKARRAQSGRGEGVPLSVPITVSAEGGKASISIGTGNERAPSDCRVSLIEFDKQQTVNIGRGENSGETITYYNVVRGSREIGRWTGGQVKLAVDMPAKASNKGYAILLQEFGRGASPGMILGATVVQ